MLSKAKPLYCSAVWILHGVYTEQSECIQDDTKFHQHLFYLYTA